MRSVTMATKSVYSSGAWLANKAWKTTTLCRAVVSGRTSHRFVLTTLDSDLRLSVIIHYYLWHQKKHPGVHFTCTKINTHLMIQDNLAIFCCILQHFAKICKILCWFATICDYPWHKFVKNPLLGHQHAGGLKLSMTGRVSFILHHPSSLPGELSGQLNVLRFGGVLLREGRNYMGSKNCLQK